MLMWHELKIITVNKHVLCPNLVSVREAFRKKARKIYDDLLKGGWVANSKHDFFSI